MGLTLECELGMSPAEKELCSSWVSSGAKDDLTWKTAKYSGNHQELPKVLF